MLETLQVFLITLYLLNKNLFRDKKKLIIIYTNLYTILDIYNG